MNQTRPLYVSFCRFHNAKTNKVKKYLNEKSVDGVLGIRTQAGRMVDADKSISSFLCSLTRFVCEGKTISLYLSKVQRPKVFTQLLHSPRHQLCHIKFKLLAYFQVLLAPKN